MSFEKPNKIESLNPGKTQELQDKFNKLSDLSDIDELMLFMDEWGNFSKILSEKYGNETNDCELYHILAGSTMGMNPTIFDFEGEDSIEAFIEASYKKYILKEDSF